MSDPQVIPASRRRSIVAALLDVCFTAAPALLLARGGRPAPAFTRWTRLSSLALELVREQVGSPGQRLLGLRTVDKRTGRRVEMWRSAVVLAVGVAGRQLARRLTPPVQTAEHEREREGFMLELQALEARHPGDPQAREAERIELFQRYPPPVTINLWRTAGPSLAAGLLTSRLRRWLAPTVEIRARRD
jgi:hypothetical protein